MNQTEHRPQPVPVDDRVCHAYLPHSLDGTVPPIGAVALCGTVRTTLDPAGGKAGSVQGCVVCLDLLRRI